MILELRKGWFRWHVYSLGHSLGDEIWLATFRYELHAQYFINKRTGKDAK